MIFSSHVLPEVERIARRVAIIRAGELVAISPIEQLLDRARHGLELRFARPVPLDLFSGVAGVTTTDALRSHIRPFGTTASSIRPSPAPFVNESGRTRSITREGLAAAPQKRNPTAQ